MLLTAPRLESAVNANAKLFWILSGFFALLAVVYTVWTLIYAAAPVAQEVAAGGRPAVAVEWTGTVALTLSAIAAALIAFYVGRTHRAQGGELPEDRYDAEIDDGDAEQGFFAPWSWWPIFLAASLATVFLGLAVGFWVAFVGAGFLVISLVGWVYEHYRGVFAH
jgi:hypothetical protein